MVPKMLHARHRRLGNRARDETHLVVPPLRTPPEGSKRRGRSAVRTLACAASSGGAVSHSPGLLPMPTGSPGSHDRGTARRKERYLGR